MLGPLLLAAHTAMILGHLPSCRLVSEILNKSVFPLNLEKASLCTSLSLPSEPPAHGLQGDFIHTPL